MHVHKPTRSLLLRAHDPFAVREALPDSKTLDLPAFNLAVKHTPDATRILRNLGYEAPSPIGSYYDWPGKYPPFNHQRVMAEFYTFHPRCFNLSEMGAGKTAATLWACDWLMNEGAMRKALVLSPLSTLERVWLTDIFDVLMHRRAAVAHGTMEKRMRALNANVDFYILNHDGIAIREIRDMLRKRPDIDTIIVDEGSKFRNSDTDKYRALERLLRPDMRLWWLTGTPTPNAPSDAWAQIKLVAPENAPKYFGAFRRRTMIEVTTHKWKPRADAADIVYAAMQPAVRFAKADCLDLPPMTTVNWDAPLSPEQKTQYKKMKDDMVMEAQSGVAVTAVNAADKLNKLRQILCGSVKTPDGRYTTINHAPRLKTVRDAIESAAAKAIVIVPFKGIIVELQRELGKYYSVGMLNGDVPVGQRNTIIKDFKERADPHVLLCHPAVMAHGLNLVEADLLAFYAPIYSNDEYRQVVERINRTGQKNKMTVVRIGANALEWAIYNMLDTRDTTQSSILKLYESVIKGESEERE